MNWTLCINVLKNDFADLTGVYARSALTFEKWHMIEDMTRLKFKWVRSQWRYLPMALISGSLPLWLQNSRALCILQDVWKCCEWAELLHVSNRFTDLPKNMTPGQMRKIHELFPTHLNYSVPLQHSLRPPLLTEAWQKIIPNLYLRDIVVQHLKSQQSSLEWGADVQWQTAWWKLKLSSLISSTGLGLGLLPPCPPERQKQSQISKSI